MTDLTSEDTSQEPSPSRWILPAGCACLLLALFSIFNFGRDILRPRHVRDFVEELQFLRVPALPADSVHTWDSQYFAHGRQYWARIEFVDAASADAWQDAMLKVDPASTDTYTGPGRVPESANVAASPWFSDWKRSNGIIYYVWISHAGGYLEFRRCPKDNVILIHRGTS